MDQGRFNLLYYAYLEHSIRYYEMDDPTISDYTFDRLCQALLRHWASYRHPLKHLTDEGDLRAGTGYRLHNKPELKHIRELIKQYGRVSVIELP